MIPRSGSTSSRPPPGSGSTRPSARGMAARSSAPTGIDRWGVPSPRSSPPNDAPFGAGPGHLAVGSAVMLSHQLQDAHDFIDLRRHLAVLIREDTRAVQSAASRAAASVLRRSMAIVIG